MLAFDWRTPFFALLLLGLAGCDKPHGDLGDVNLPATEDATTGSGGSTTDPTTGESGENPAGVCDPAAGSACPEDYICCSDDPAVLGGKRPNFFMDGAVNEQYGDPLFAGERNELSSWGQCVQVGGFTSPFASGCPVPCNPRWESARVAEFCGTSVCCPFTQVDPARDCVIDPETQRWRTVTGEDIPALTNWGSVHATNQDPFGSSCTIIATGEGPDEDVAGPELDQAVFEECIDQLTVADRRGFCYDGALCPCVEDVCDQKNPGWVPRCSG